VASSDDFPPPDQPQPDLIPQGFPHQLSDDELEQAAERFASGFRQWIVKNGLGSTHEGIVLGYGALLDVARNETFRRHLRRSETLSRVALLVAIVSAIITIVLAVAR
jgi:hypothetical protein